MAGKLLKLLCMVVGGWVGWYLGASLGQAAGFILSIVGLGVGLYIANRFILAYLD